MIVKYSYLSEDADEQEFELQPSVDNTTLRKCYTERLPISKLKYKDLQKLCRQNTIPEEFHEEYLRMSQSNDVVDYLNDTDNEEEEDEITEQ